MKLTPEELTKMLHNQIKQILASDEVTSQFKEIAQSIIQTMQSTLVKPGDSFKLNSEEIRSLYPFAKVEGGYMTTAKGSVLNLKNKSKPWVVISPELESWAKDFAYYLKTGNVTKLLSENVDTAGGYLVPEEFNAVMIMYDTEPTGVWPRATVWPMKGEKISFPKLLQNPDVDDGNFDHFAGVTFAWTEEGGEKQATQPEFGLVEMIVHELSGYTEITNILLDDSVINLINYLTNIFRAAWYWITDKSFIDGTGGKKPLGIINDPQVLTVQRQTASTVTVDDLLNMDAKLPAVFDQSAVWFYSKKIRAAVRGQKVSNASNELVLQETYSSFADGYITSMLGRPAILMDGKIPAIGTHGDLILGDWKWYYIGFRQDFVMDSSRHYAFRNNRTALRCSGRVDGQAAMPQAFVVLTDPS
jgi:HK97 family phage major capsid protein